jgi:hypothetical protein
MACSKFSYKSNINDEPTLVTDSKFIGGCMKDLLQNKSGIAGVEIVRMELKEYSYHPEIA